MRNVIIVGSGPVGSAFAKKLHDLSSDFKITQFEVGPKVSDSVGRHSKNFQDDAVIEGIQQMSQGPNSQIKTDASRMFRGVIVARPGTYLVEEGPEAQMPALAMSANVGGMGIHWTGACPTFNIAELPDFINLAEFEKDFEEARGLLKVTQSAYEGAPLGDELRERLGEKYNVGRSVERQVQSMPLAVQVKDGQLWWTGTEEILGDLVASNRYSLIPDTLVTELVHDGVTVSSVKTKNMATNQISQVPADLVFIAADAIRTPQLMFNSKITLTALGRYLNEHGQILGLAKLPAELKSSTSKPAPKTKGLNTTGVGWIPYEPKSFPAHGQIMQMDTSPIPLEGVTEADPGSFVGVGLFVAKQISADDRVEFSNSETDSFGMPKPSIFYAHNDEDNARFTKAKGLVSEVCQTIGEELGSGPIVMPIGSSLHYLGTVRMGSSNDGKSVCDLDSKVWGFSNLYVGGNGVIPTETAGNPTATSIAFAIKAARSIVRGDEIK
jgi:choline dehydrogenase-like flavoprotein